MSDRCTADRPGLRVGRVSTGERIRPSRYLGGQGCAYKQELLHSLTPLITPTAPRDPNGRRRRGPRGSPISQARVQPCVHRQSPGPRRSALHGRRKNKRGRGASSAIARCVIAASSRTGPRCSRCWRSQTCISLAGSMPHPSIRARVSVYSADRISTTLSLSTASGEDVPEAPGGH